jgi:hypothetical protein
MLAHRGAQRFSRILWIPCKFSHLQWDVVFILDATSIEKLEAQLMNRVSSTRLEAHVTAPCTMIPLKTTQQTRTITNRNAGALEMKIHFCQHPASAESNFGFCPHDLKGSISIIANKGVTATLPALQPPSRSSDHV